MTDKTKNPETKELTDADLDKAQGGKADEVGSFREATIHPGLNATKPPALKANTPTS